ncbi:MAG: chromate transporter [Clostridia bacterium]
MIYLQLFCSFFKIGCFSIGGGYASLPLIKEEVVTKLGFLDISEFTDIITISQMTPGPIAINSATFVGTKIAGVLGSVVATLGFVTPSLILVITLAYLFFKYNNITFIANILSFLKPMIVGIIGCVALEIFASAVVVEYLPFIVDFKALIIFGLCFYLIMAKNMAISKIIALSAVLGVFFY